MPHIRFTTSCARVPDSPAALFFFLPASREIYTFTKKPLLLFARRDEFFSFLQNFSCASDVYDLLRAARRRIRIPKVEISFGYIVRAYIQRSSYAREEICNEYIYIYIHTHSNVNTAAALVYSVFSFST